MNLSRGLFRFWLVLSVVWTGGVAMFGPRLDRAATLQGRAVQSTVATGGSAQWPAVMSKEERHLPFDPYLAAGIAPSPGSFPSAAPGEAGALPTATTNSGIHNALWSVNGPVLLSLAFLPPAILLAMGLALRWVARGFQPQADHP